MCCMKTHKESVAKEFSDFSRFHFFTCLLYFCFKMMTIILVLKRFTFYEDFSNLKIKSY